MWDALLSSAKEENENENKVSNVVWKFYCWFGLPGFSPVKRLSPKQRDAVVVHLVHSFIHQQMSRRQQGIAQSAWQSVSQCKLKRNSPFHTLFLHFPHFLFLFYCSRFCQHTDNTSEAAQKWHQFLCKRHRRRVMCTTQTHNPTKLTFFVALSLCFLFLSSN